ncbi:Rieske 2Fe-2S domain-containing protein [uncultured Meiothermus sp.]|jgi:rieske iron-sulfur protein|uniref:QcrA and Rieske domain-containing protein n=1 Tax=uncultured Meiothermus sp. TaxID=157471 RepID=UPI0026298B65|nr:Rieske 2Fe-2S domain-containing protein [uncultured Meiothermus sp.]
MMSAELSHDQPGREEQLHRQRRAVLQAGIGVAVGVTALSTLYVSVGLIPRRVVTPKNEPVKAGDLLTSAERTGPGVPLTPDDLSVGGPPMLAYPMHPETGVVKSEATANYLKLARFRPEELAEETRRYAAEGVVAYSAVCTHLGCTVSQWEAAAQVMRCPCHGGLYDPRDAARVVGGPPPRPLPQLPLRLAGGRLVVAGDFTGKVGPG